ncbi:MAG TPA: TonB-dependent receptor [Cellvibrio sp.]|nr:TonB-dependent receptor [Cellvibrio sp.]
MLRVSLLRKKWLLSHCALYGLGLPGSALAAHDYLDLSLEQLINTKVLSVSKKAEAVADAPAAVYVVTGDDIARAGVTTIPDALRMVPGVFVARADTNTWAISIRGFNSPLANKLLVMLDGRTIYNPVFGGVLWDAHDLMLEDIAQIEVVRGPGGTLWGANAVNGVINITTKQARDTQGNLASALYGNEEQGTVSARHGGSVGDQGFYRLYGKAFKRDSSHSPRGGAAYDQWDGARGGFRVDWGESFTFQGDAYRTSGQQRKIDFSPVAPYSPVVDQTIVYDGANLLARWTDKRDDGSQWNIQSYVDWTRRDEPYNFTDKRVTYDLDVQYNFAASDLHEFIIGGNFRYMSSDEVGTANVEFSPARRQDSVYSAFVQDKITLVDEKLFLILGSKIEQNEFSGEEVQPNIRLQWSLGPAQTLWSSASQAVRTPTPIEEDINSTILTNPLGRAAFVPNNQFKSEELTAYELGYRNQITPAISLDLASFYNEYEHLQTITFLPLVPVGPNPFPLLAPVIFSNNMKGRSHGIEAAFSWSIHEDLRVALNYTFLHMTLKAFHPVTHQPDPSQLTAKPIYPKYQTGAKIYWNMNDAWTLDTSFAYVDKLYESRTPDYVRMDINLGGKLSHSLRLNLVGQNLLDNRHMEFNVVSDLNAAEVERSIFARLTYEF